MPLKINFEKLNNPWLHIAFWVGYFVIALSIFIVFFDVQFAVVRVVVTGLVHALLAYTVLCLLIPKLFMKGWYILHYTLIGILLVVTSVFRVYMDSWLNGPVGVVPIEMFSLTHYISKGLSGLIVVGICHSFKFIEFSWTQQRKQEELEKQNLEAELKLLKNQVNPHFLFNTLNNIYSLAYTNSKETAPMVLKLSELMRYMLYESDDKQVPLEKEIEYLKNYIELHKLKKSNGAGNIQFTVDGDIKDKQIAPMLFIPFFENAFKHGNIDKQAGYLKSELSVDGEAIIFNIKNSVGNLQKDENGGIGLENVKKRLKLLYPQKHQLEIVEQKDTFEVTLKIETK